MVDRSRARPRCRGHALHPTRSTEHPTRSTDRARWQAPRRPPRSRAAQGPRAPAETVAEPPSARCAAVSASSASTALVVGVSARSVRRFDLARRPRTTAWPLRRRPRSGGPSSAPCSRSASASGGAASGSPPSSSPRSPHDGLPAAPALPRPDPDLPPGRAPRRHPVSAPAGPSAKLDVARRLRRPAHRPRRRQRSGDGRRMLLALDVVGDDRRDRSGAGRAAPGHRQRGRVARRAGLPTLRPTPSGARGRTTPRRTGRPRPWSGEAGAPAPGAPDGRSVAEVAAEAAAFAGWYNFYRAHGALGTPARVALRRGPAGRRRCSAWA